MIKSSVGSEVPVSVDEFSKALYLIDIGQNDLTDSFSKNLTYSEVIKRVPSIIAEIKSAIKVSSCLKWLDNFKNFFNNILEFLFSNC